MPMRQLAVLLAIVAVAGASRAGSQSTGHYQDFGDARGFLNIVPPGQDGVLNGSETILAQGGTYPPHVIDQLGMYGDLVYNVPGLTEDRLLEFYKDASFGVPEAEVDRVYSPTANVTVVRDASFGVPHIFGETRYATMFAQGYTGAEDRLFLMDTLRHLGRARLSEFLGASPSNQAMDRDQLAIAPYTEADLTAQLELIRDSGPEGMAGYQDLLAYVDGVNQYITDALADPVNKLPAEYPALQQVPQTWKPEDAIAIASLVGGIFGKGGGGELTNHCGLAAMTAALGDAATARAVFDDFHFANDPEAPTTATATFPYMTDLGPVDPASHPDVDCASLVPIDTTGPPLQELLDAISGLQPKPRAVCVPSTTNGVPSVLDLDHVACAKASHPSPRFVARTVTLADEFETKTTLVRKPDAVCTPVDADGIGVRNPTSALVCYRLKDGAGQPRFAARDVSVANELGTETVGALKSRTRVCALGGRVAMQRIATLLALFAAAPAAAQVARGVEPVVVTGAQMPVWSRLPAAVVCAPYAGDAGSLVYIVELKGATTLENPAVVPYYRDDACLDDGTGDDPVPRPWPGEASTDQTVRDGYSSENGGTPYDQLTCAQRQGAWRAHGVHYFVTNDTDNAASPGTLTEIDAQQWQFMVPTAAPTNVGEAYGDVVRAPLEVAAVRTVGLPNPTSPGTGSPAPRRPRRTSGIRSRRRTTSSASTTPAVTRSRAQAPRRAANAAAAHAGARRRAASSTGAATARREARRGAPSSSRSARASRGRRRSSSTAAASTSTSPRCPRASRSPSS
jgi:penicillin amidase